MTETSSSATVGPSVPRQSGSDAPEPTGWVGWIAFAAFMMIMVGAFHVIQGLVAIFQDDYYLVTDNGLTVHLDYSAWGWTHVIAGIVLAGAGMSLFSGAVWARVLGVAVAGLSALLNFAFIAAYPFWSVIVIAIDVFVILALTVHGREMKGYGREPTY